MSETPCAAILSAHALTIRHGDRPALIDGLDLTLGRGDILALLGPNGRGKSSLLRALAGLAPPQAGRVARTGRIAWLPQNLVPAFAFPARLVAVMGRMAERGAFSQPGRADWAAADAALARLGIGHLADRPVTQLSGGERQLVWLARALAAEVRLFLLDEPAAPLDLRNQARLLQLLRRLAAEEDATVLFTTHDPDHARLAGGRVLMLFGEGDWQEGPADTMLTADMLGHLYQIGFHRAVTHDGATIIVPDYNAA